MDTEDTDQESKIEDTWQYNDNQAEPIVNVRTLEDLSR
jgi:hypothetical protein